MKNRILSTIMPVLPKNELSHLVGRLVHQPLPGLMGRKSVEMFARYYGINLQEAEFPVEHYKSIGDLFIRRLKPGVRPIGAGVVHPADAVITEAAQINAQTLIQAKGKTYSVEGILGGTKWAKDFEGGQFATYYLCPTDYHRVHSPVDGAITWSRHVPGALWPVNDWSVNSIDNLFAINERIVTGFETEKGKVVLVMVAATNVGNMSMSYDPEMQTEVRRGPRNVTERNYLPKKTIARGDEVGVFHMGSTVVMLYEKGVLSTELTKFSGRAVKMGASVD